MQKEDCTHPVRQTFTTQQQVRIDKIYNVTEFDLSFEII